MSLNLMANPGSFIKSIVAVVFVMATAISVAGQTQSRAWMKGTWEGTGYQIDDKSTWEMKVTARGRSFRIDYPSLNCGGRWKLISSNQSRARFREILDHGQDKCADRGSVLIQRLNRRQIVFLYTYKDAREISASAVLTRKIGR